MDSSSARDDALLLTVSKCERDCSLCVGVPFPHAVRCVGADSPISLSLWRLGSPILFFSTFTAASWKFGQFRLPPGFRPLSTEGKKHDTIGRHVVCSAKGIRRSAILYGVPRCSSDTGIYTRSRSESMARNPCNGTCDEALYRMSRTGRNNLGGLI